MKKKLYPSMEGETYHYSAKRSLKPHFLKLPLSYQIPHKQLLQALLPLLDIHPLSGPCRKNMQLRERKKERERKKKRVNLLFYPILIFHISYFNLVKFYIVQQLEHAPVSLVNIITIQCV